jgi:hypothetical protein
LSGACVEVGSFGLLPVVAGSGAGEPGAVPGGVFVVGEAIVPVVPVGVPVVSVGGVLPTVEPLPIEPEDDGDGVDDVASPDVVLPDEVEPVAAVLPVVPVVDGFDIELSVFGVSVLLQAVRAVAAVTAAVMAIHLIERSMFAPVVGGGASFRSDGPPLGRLRPERGVGVVRRPS